MADRVEVEIERVTSDSNLSEDMGAMLDLIDRISKNIIDSDQFLKTLSKRIRNGVKSPFVLIQCLSLANMTVKNCDENVKLKISGREFIDSLKFIGEKGPPMVANRLAHLLRNWIDNEDFIGKQHSLIFGLYMDLIKRGFGKDVNYEKLTGATPWERASAIKEKEENDLAEAIAESLKISSARVGDKDVSGEVCSTELRPGNVVKALFDFEALESDELSFSAGDLITLIKCDGKSGWWTGRINDKIGMFPTTFVSKGLDDKISVMDKLFDSDDSENAESTQGPTLTIDESKIDECLQFIHGLDPLKVSEDTKTRQDMEDACYRMGPLIDTELNRIDNLLDECNDAYSKLVASLQTYHKITDEQIRISRPQSARHSTGAQAQSFANAAINQPNPIANTSTSIHNSTVPSQDTLQEVHQEYYQQPMPSTNTFAPQRPTPPWTKSMPLQQHASTITQNPSNFQLTNMPTDASFFSQGHFNRPPQTNSTAESQKMTYNQHGSSNSHYPPS